jgi:hypothetical protein
MRVLWWWTGGLRWAGLAAWPAGDWPIAPANQRIK